jgi:hypothetical protein
MGYYRDYRYELEAMGFDFSPQKETYGWLMIQMALHVYAKIYGDLLVPYIFVVPENDTTWPEELWGMKLGITVSSIRCNNVYANHKEELKSMGFDFSCQSNAYGWDIVKSALENYKALHGNLLVPSTFIVPEGDSAWPEEVWDMKLGKVVRSFRSSKDELESISALNPMHTAGT